MSSDKKTNTISLVLIAGLVIVLAALGFLIYDANKKANEANESAGKAAEVKIEKKQKPATEAPAQTAQPQEQPAQ